MAEPDPLAPLPDADSITTLLGDVRPPPPLAAEARARIAAALRDAEAAYERAPDDPDALIWLGRRLGYAGRIDAAVRAFTSGVERFPTDARFLRHRGHRLITLRRFAAAAADFERAAALTEGTPDAVEPDGMPNARGMPTSTLHTNIWYHLALARYLLGDFEAALAAQRRCLALARNADMRVASLYWLYLTLRRLGRDAEAAEAVAAVTPDLDVIENGAYHRLLLVYRGLEPPEAVFDARDNTNAALNDATAGYGIGAWHLVEGRAAEADTTFRRVYAGPQWGAFGFIAAEAELARS